MHLFDLGVTWKLFITWVRGPFLTKLHHSLVDVISSRLETLSEFIPREFARATRSLKFLDRSIQGNLIRVNEQLRWPRNS